MVLKNNSANIYFSQTIAPDVRGNISLNGASVDLQGFDAALIKISIGDYTDGNHLFKVQHSDDNITFVDVTDDELSCTISIVDSIDLANGITKVGYLGSKRYLRVALNVTEATSGAASAACIVCTLPHHAPI